jgi:hypothetical protein
MSSATPPNSSGGSTSSSSSGGAKKSSGAVADTAVATILVVLMLAIVVAVSTSRTFGPFDPSQWFERHLFWMLALIPAAISIVNYWVAEKRRFRRGVEQVEQRHDEIKRHMESVPGPKQADWDSVLERLQSGLEDGREPRFSYTLLGAVLLTLVFGIAAQLSIQKLGSTPSHGIGPAIGTGAADEAKGMNEAIRALVFASYGAYVFVLRAMIGRLNALALSGRFLVRVSLQSAGTIVLGFVIGYVGAVSVAATTYQSTFVYFLIGMFPGWAAQLIAEKAREIFAAREAGCERLPLCMIDGIEDEIADRLAEVNIWDIQHLATADPIDLTLRTQYPLDRILDWIDQSILITYARTSIPLLRNLGIRGAIDLAVLADGNIEADLAAREAMTPEQIREAGLSPQTIAAATMRREASTELFTALRDQTPLKHPRLLAQALYEDGAVDLIWRIWQRKRND